MTSDLMGHAASVMYYDEIPQEGPDDWAAQQGGVIQTLVPCDDAVLHRVAEPVDFTTTESQVLKQLYLDMSATMRHNKGIGLAAPQIGQSLRALVIESPYGAPIGLFNPTIVDQSPDTTVMDEGCLSYPGLVVKIKRPIACRVRFWQYDGSAMTRQFTGMSARVVQHEIDHLDGIVMRDRAGRFHWEQAIKQLNKRK